MCQKILILYLALKCWGANGFTVHALDLTSKRYLVLMCAACKYARLCVEVCAIMLMSGWSYDERYLETDRDKTMYYVSHQVL